MSEVKRWQYKVDSLRAGDLDVVRLRFTFPKKTPVILAAPPKTNQTFADHRLTHVFKVNTDQYNSLSS